MQYDYVDKMRLLDEYYDYYESYLHIFLAFIP
jgi:hypothetical protein